MNKWLRTTGVFLVVGLFPVIAAAKLTKQGDATVKFQATGPAGFKMEGTTHDLAVNEDAGKLAFAVKLATVKSGIDLRDKHMCEKYLHCDKYPEAKLVVDKSALKLPDAGAESAGSAPGQLTIHGQTKPVTVAYKVKRDGNSYNVHASTHIKYTEFGVEQAGYGPVSVKPDVDIVVDFKANDS